MAIAVGAAYGVTYAVVQWSVSPTRDRVTLADGRVVASLVMNEAGPVAERVVLAHGAPADAGSWRKLVRDQSGVLAGAEVVAIDRLGYGNSTDAAETSLAQQAASLGPFIEPGTILVGHSYGGPVVLRAAVEHADQLAGIVLVAGACDPYMNDAVWFRRLVDGSGVLVPRTWHNANAELLALTDENLAMVELLGRVTCPVVIVHGTWDPVCPHDGTVEYLSGALVNAAEVRVVSLDRAGHNLHLSHTEEVGAAIGSLRTTPAPGSQ